MKKTFKICLVTLLIAAFILGISSVALAATDDGSISVASGGTSGAIGRDVYLNIKAPSSLPDGATDSTWTYFVSVSGAFSDSGKLDCGSTTAVLYKPTEPGTKTATVFFTCGLDSTKYSKKEISIAASNSIINMSSSSVTYSDGLTVKANISNPCPDGIVTVNSSALSVQETTKGLSSYTILLNPTANVNDTYKINYESSSFNYTSTTFTVKKASESGPKELKIKTMPDKTDYKVGEYFNPTGLVLELTLKDGSKQLINDGYLYEDHKFTASEAGKTVNVNIRYTYNGETKECACPVDCVGSAAPLTALHLNKGKITLNVGTSDVIVATTYPENTADVTIKYESKNSAIAKVNTEGVVTAIAPGDTYIIVTATDGTVTLTSNCYVTVPKQDEITSITLSPKSFKLLVDDSTTLTCTVKPSTIENPVITWKTSNADVCTVVNGQITGVKAGTAMITATCNGYASNTIITVVDEISEVVRIVNCKKGVNCRASASGSAKVIGTAYLDSEYKLLGQSGSWYKIQFTSTKIGYVYKTFVETSDGKKYTPDTVAAVTTADPTATATPEGTVSKVTIINCTRRVYVKASASTSAKTLGYAELGSTWSLKGKTSDGAWYVVDYNGENGYIQTKFCLVG